MYPKFYIGPMSKNIVDAIIEWQSESKIPIGLIPSRRQVDWDGGYVNNWTTKEFADYIGRKSKNPYLHDIILERDHAGPNQGSYMDDGLTSLKYDCEDLDIIHIDPWKKHPGLYEGIEATISMIEFCNSINPYLKYEIGTEESIRKFTLEELETVIRTVRNRLGAIFYKVKYIVIQCGTSLKGTTQTGVYDKSKLIDMVALCIKHGLLSKEHNGDYQSSEDIYGKFMVGLNSINIAPEFGVIETQTYLQTFNDINVGRYEEIPFLDTFYDICYQSKKWEKWVDKDFDPINQYIELVNICGHYVLSTPEFIEKIKNVIPFDMDFKIKENIKQKLNELHGI